MSSFTGRFKRSRSKSEKATTPPKVVFGDLGSAYATITQKGTAGTPPSRGAIRGGVASPTEMYTTWSPLQSPQSDKSASAPLLPNKRPDAIRLSHLSGDLFLPKGFGSSLPETSQVFDPFSITGHKQDSVGPSDVKTELPDVHYGMTDGKTTDASYGGPEEVNVISPYNYPDLPEDQPELCSNLSGAGQIDVCDTPPPDRCGTIRRIATRHNYGEVGTNDDIRSFRGSHIHVSNTEDDGEFKGPAALQQDITEEVQWSPRPSSDLYVLDNHAAERMAGGPPSMTLPATPQNRKAPKYGEPYDCSSPMAQTSHSSQSYGNTRRLLELSLPHFPHASPINDNLFQNLVNFAKEGQSSSSHGHSSKSFATFSIEETQGNPITRPVSQGEFQHLETAISAHLRRTSRTSNTAAGVEFRRVGQISLTFSEGSGSEIGPGSSQTTSSSEHEPDLDFNAVRPTPRTRNGTPPLLFRSSSRAKRETDWETVGESNQTTSSVADFSDSASGSPPKSLLSVDASKVLKHPPHPRYNHSWDLQQDVRSGAFVLTPRHRLSAGISVPSNNGVAPIPFRGARNYSHPVPLTARHRHPFVSPAPSMAPSPSAVVLQQKQHPDVDNKETAIESQGSSTWLSTTGTSTLLAITGFAETYELSTVLKAPPLPTKNPYRQRRNFASDEQIELQDFLSSPPRFVPRSAQNSSRNTGQVSSDMGLSCDTESAPIFTGITPASSSAGPNSLVRLRSPRRRSEGPLPACPRLKRHAPDPTPPATYEQKVARRYLAICACLPVLLPLYALRYLDFMMRIHTHGVYRAFPEWERRAAWGILVIWVMVALCVVPFATFVDRF
ncbi:MAG: hypothetical protein Q9210_000308 [Variospora velana]